jgi:hypothetical protein
MLITTPGPPRAGTDPSSGFEAGGVSSAFAWTSFTAAHHDEVVAMHAVDDASAAAVGPIMPPTLEMSVDAY